MVSTAGHMDPNRTHGTRVTERTGLVRSAPPLRSTAAMRSPKSEVVVRDSGPYSARNSSKGALVGEAGRIFAALGESHSIEEVKRAAIDGQILAQRSRSTRERIWHALHHRYLSHHLQWMISDLVAAGSRGVEEPEFLSLLYLHYALRDRLTYDFATGFIYSQFDAGRTAVFRDDLLNLMDAAQDQPQIRAWTQKSRVKLAGSILSALRDFGALTGSQHKRITRPPLPLETAEHILRLLHAEGVSDTALLANPTWRLFMLNESEVADMLRKIPVERRLRLEVSRGTVLLQVPRAWHDDPQLVSGRIDGKGGTT